MSNAAKKMTVPSLAIRRAGVADAEAVHAIFLAAKREISIDGNINNAKGRDWIRKNCRAGNVVYAHLGETVVGMALVAQLKVNEVSYLAVAPEYRGQKIGLTLFQS